MKKTIIMMICLLSANTSFAEINPFEFEEVDTNKKVENYTPDPMRGMPRGGGGPIIDDFAQPEERAKQFFGLNSQYKLMVTVNDVKIYHNSDLDQYIHIDDKELQKKVMEYKNGQ